VLLLAHELGTDETSVRALFYPLYWSLTFFPGQGKTHIGLLLDEEHPAFNEFPTSFHSNWQWESISSDAKGFILNDLPHEYRPIAQPIDDFHRNNKVGAILELKLGAGALLVCGYNLDSGKPVARQLKTSLLTYMSSQQFNPSQQVSEDWLRHTFQRIPEVEKATLPGAFGNAVLYVDAAAWLQEEKEQVPWESEFDEVSVAEDVSYVLYSGGSWKEGRHSAWAGSELEIHLSCPDGMLGTLLVCYSDYNHMMRRGLLDFEGRQSRLGEHAGEEYWVRFHVMREDSNDGQLILNSRAESGGNLMISQIVLIQEN
jgi:hypothetical protein